MRRSLTPPLRRASWSLAIALAVALSMAASPPPSGPGPASPEPPLDRMPVPTGPLFPVASVNPLDRPSGAGAAIEPPAEMLGAWYSGSVSSVGYVDPTVGSYSSGGSEGLMYAFLPDGTWQSGWLLSSQLYGCAMRVMVYRDGTLVESDPAAGMLRLDTATAQIHSEDSCSADGNYDRDLPTDDETLYWARANDTYGEVLMLRGPDTSWSPFRPMDQG